MNLNTTFIDLQNLHHHSRGDNREMTKYLCQFLELVPKRAECLRANLRANDRQSIRRILHQMKPQLQFFGLVNVLATIYHLEEEYETMALEELRSLGADILVRLEGAVSEVDTFLKINL